MTLLVKLVALVAVLAVVVPLVAGDSPAGQLLRAAWADIAGFCNRQPDACEEGAALARDAGSFIADTLADLGGTADPGTLTEADRTIVPRSPEAAAPHTAFSAHGEKPAP